VGKGRKQREKRGSRGDSEEKEKEEEERDSKGKKQRKQQEERRRGSSVGGTALPHCHLRPQRRSRRCEPTRAAPPPRSQCREGGENDREKKNTERSIASHRLRHQAPASPPAAPGNREEENERDDKQKQKKGRTGREKNKRKGEDGGPKHVVAFVASR